MANTIARIVKSSELEAAVRDRRDAAAVTTDVAVLLVFVVLLAVSVVGDGLPEITVEPPPALVPDVEAEMASVAEVDRPELTPVTDLVLLPVKLPVPAVPLTVPVAVPEPPLIPPVPLPDPDDADAPEETGEPLVEILVAEVLDETDEVVVVVADVELIGTIDPEMTDV